MPRASFRCLLLLASALLSFAPSAASDEEPVMRIYDIGFLISHQPDFPGEYPDTPRSAPDCSRDFRLGFVSADEIVDEIRTNFDEDSWSDGKNSIATVDDALVVVNRPEVHDSIAGYLGELRSRHGRQIVVDVELVETSPAQFAAMEAAAPEGWDGLVLAPAQTSLLEGALKTNQARLLRAARAVAFSGQRVHVRDSLAHAFLKDYDVEIAAKSTMPDPIEGQLDEGWFVGVRPYLEFGDTRVTLEIQCENRTLTQMDEADMRLPGNGRVQLPVVECVGLTTSLSTPLEQTVLASRTSRSGTGGERLVLLLLARSNLVRIIDPPAAPPDSKERRRFRMFDVGFLVRSLIEFEGPKLGLQPDADEAMAAATAARDVAEGLRIRPDALVELVRTNVAGESWGNRRNKSWVSADRLMVVQTPDVLTQIEEYLRALAQGRDRTIVVEALAIRLAGMRAMRSEGPTLLRPGGTVTAEEVRALLEEARSGGEVTVLGEASAAGRNRQRCSGFQTTERIWLPGYEVEIAEESAIGDPAVRRMREGLVLEVQPSLAGDGQGILLDLRGDLAWLARPVSWFDTGAVPGGRVHVPSLRQFRTRVTLLTRDGEWTLAGLATPPEGGAREVLLVRARKAVLK